MCQSAVLWPSKGDCAALSAAAMQANERPGALRSVSALPRSSAAGSRNRFHSIFAHRAYQDLESTIWILWQVRPCDVTVNHIGHALYLLTRKSKGGVERDRASCEARGIDYAT